VEAAQRFQVISTSLVNFKGITLLSVIDCYSRCVQKYIQTTMVRARLVVDLIGKQEFWFLENFPGMRSQAKLQRFYQGKTCQNVICQQWVLFSFDMVSIYWMRMCCRERNQYKTSHSAERFLCELGFLIWISWACIIGSPGYILFRKRPAVLSSCCSPTYFKSWPWCRLQYTVTEWACFRITCFCKYLMRHETELMFGSLPQLFESRGRAMTEWIAHWTTFKMR